MHNRPWPPRKEATNSFSQLFTLNPFSAKRVVVETGTPQSKLLKSLHGRSPAQSRPLLSACMHKFQISGGGLISFSLDRPKMIPVFFFTVFVAKPIPVCFYLRSPNPRRGDAGEAGCGAYADELGKGEANSSGLSVFGFSRRYPTMGKYDLISLSPEPNTRGSHQPMLPHQPLAHRFLSQKPRCMNPTPFSSSISSQMRGVTPSPSTVRTPVIPPGRASSGAPPGAGPDQASLRYDSLASSDSIYLSCIFMLCASHMSTTATGTTVYTVV